MGDQIFSIFFRPGEIEASVERMGGAVKEALAEAIAQYKKDYQPLPIADNAATSTGVNRALNNEPQYKNPIIPGINNNLF